MTPDSLKGLAERAEPWFPTQVQRDRYDELLAEVHDDGTCVYCDKFVLVGIGHEECGPNDD